MARIYRTSDRIEVRIEDIVVKLAPLTLHQKTEIHEAMAEGRSKANIKEATRGIALAIKYSLKSISGVVDSNDEPYQLKFDSTGEISDDTVDELLNLELSNKLALVCSAMINGVPKEFKDLDGVEMVKKEQAAEEKKD